MGFTQIVDSHQGELIFTSSQDDIVHHLSGFGINDFEGVCLALVMRWFKQDTAKKNPFEGTKNKTRALHLQASMALEGANIYTAAKVGPGVTGMHFWWRSEEMHAFGPTKTEPAGLLQNDPQHRREGAHILVLYFEPEGAHAIGVWRFPSGTLAFYDPNHGACAVGAQQFPGFLGEFVNELYPDVKGFAVCSFYRDAR